MMKSRSIEFLGRYFSERKNRKRPNRGQLMLTWKNSIADTLCPQPAGGRETAGGAIDVGMEIPILHWQVNPDFP